ncbi:MAG: hypothetical protein HY291_22640 [Planctomycetes bacterium]|nr:hypothetical protein [Planctomycetota bacterium]
MTSGRCVFPAVTVLALVALLGVSHARAEGDTPEGGSGKKEYPFELLKDADGKPLRNERGNFMRFNKASGVIEEVSPNDLSKPVNLSAPKDRADTQKAQPLSKAGNHGPVIDEVNGEPVDKDDHDSARKDVADYGSEIGISQALQVDGEKITGLVRVTNNGQKRLASLELTLYVPTANNKTVEHRILMADRAGCEAPPPPGKAGSALNKVDFSLPEVVKGQLEIKVTYLKFAQQ